MSKETKVFFGIIIGIVVIIAGALIVNAKTPGKYDDFAQCITNSGAKFYGAYWCPHCQAQKQAFGKSAKKLPYVECAKNQSEQTQICIDQNVQSYPTWEFSDGSRVTGEQTFDELAAKTSCVAPVK